MWSHVVTLGADAIGSAHSQGSQPGWAKLVDEQLHGRKSAEPIADGARIELNDLKSKPQLGKPGKTGPAVFAFMILSLSSNFTTVIHNEKPSKLRLEGLTDNVWSQSIASA